MSAVGLLMGIVVIVMGILYLFMGLKGKWIVLKRADEESPEEVRVKKIRQTRRIYTIIGIASVVFGIIGILSATVWAP
jgi:uncharacterized membrane protein YfcA